MRSCSPLIWVLISLPLILGKDLYSLLDLPRSATLQEIKKSYRLKAKLTHPDKISWQDQQEKTRKIDEINQQFHEITEAYEILSDENTRRQYDLTGKTPSEMEEEKRTSWRSSRWNYQQYSSNNSIKLNPLYHQIARQIKICQQLCITVTGYRHFMNLIREEELEEHGASFERESCSLDSSCANVNDDIHEKKYLLQRYILLAFYNSSSVSCLNKLYYEELYPWPFAGFTRTTDQTMHWEEILMTFKVDISQSTTSATDVLALLSHFQLSYDDVNSDCPIIVFLPRQQPILTLSQYEIWKPSSSTVAYYYDWVWSLLKMKLRIVNKTPWVIHQWWIHGNRGTKLDSIPVGEVYSLQTFISHAFIYRADFVEGNALNNQVIPLFFSCLIFSNLELPDVVYFKN